MSPDLMWATFKSKESPLPVTIYFFNNKTWDNIDHSRFNIYVWAVILIKDWIVMVMMMCCGLLVVQKCFNPSSLCPS